MIQNVQSAASCLLGNIGILNFFYLSHYYTIFFSFALFLPLVKITVMVIFEFLSLKGYLIKFKLL